MRNTYHLCLSSHDEVMCRSKEDLIIGFNCLAVAVLETGSRLLADGHMTNHFHTCLCTDSPEEVMRQRRYAYSRYFNAKYSRKGRMGERLAFISQIEGARHTTACISYVGRQGLHHGISETAFGYEHCSANAIFRKELGKNNDIVLMPSCYRNRYLPERSRIPSKFRMNSDGLLLREDIIDVGYVEEIFHTPQGYLYHMNRKSDNKWKEEQKEDENGYPPITLQSIEPESLHLDIKELRNNEYGRKDFSRMSDIELCAMIDGFYAPRQIHSSEPFISVYLLADRQRADMANRIWTDMRNKGKYLPEPWNDILHRKTFSLEQLSRCAVIKPSKR